MSIARTMMLHAAIHWPDMADLSLWPMAVQHAGSLHNHVPSPSTGLCPHDLFFKTQWSQAKFHDLHVWGCPVYVLDKTLSDGKKLPHWTSWASAPSIPARSPWCSTREQVPSHPNTMWCSLMNSPPSVPMKTPCPTSTPTCGPSSLVKVPSSLSSMMNLRSMLLTSQMTKIPMPLPSMTIDTQPSWQLMMQSLPSFRYQFHLPLRLLSPPTHLLPHQMTPSLSQREIPSQSQRVPIFSPVATPLPHAAPPVSSTLPFSPSPPPSPPMATSPPLPEVSSPIPPLSLAPPISAFQREPQAAPPCCSQHASKCMSRLIDTLDPNKKSYIHTAALGLHYAEAMEQEQFNINCLHVLKATASNPDIRTYDKILQDSELVEWKKAATNGIASLEEKGTWKEVSIDQAQGTILPGTWEFWRKRLPTGHVIQFPPEMVEN